MCIIRKQKKLAALVSLALFVIMISACSNWNSAKSDESINLWTWISGSDTANQAGVYGTQGTIDSTNSPGARFGSISWTASDGSFQLFGGYGLDNTGNIGYLNDLWLFDGTNWTWVSGSNTRNQTGTYGTKGTANAANIPSGRYLSGHVTDAAGNLWLFGGKGYDSTGTWGYLNDLWKFDGTNWTWVSGSNTRNQAGTYGTKGTTNASNIPSSRTASTLWIDAAGNLWLFGGEGYDSSGVNWGYLNDLWKFDGTSWTWISGSNTRNQAGIYGSKGVSDAASTPGSGSAGTGWIDKSGILWLFGRIGYDSTGSLTYLNDLWKFDGTSWTWISGSDVGDQNGYYGSKGTTDSANIPGGRCISNSWKDAEGNVWIFGGKGCDETGNSGYLNDLWMFNGSSWTWITGSETINQNGSYGTKGTAETTALPGSRSGGSSFIDLKGNLWIFGGEGYDTTGTSGYLNDLWIYQP